MKTTERGKAKRSRPALVTKILAAGASAAATVGLVGAMAAGKGPATTSSNGVQTPTAPRPVIVILKTVAPSVRRPASAVVKPRVVRRYVAAPSRRRRPTTTTKAS